jgi:hypothetical protein
MEAINAPAGHLAQALFNDPRKNGLVPGAGFPLAWLRQVDDLLSLAGDVRRHAIVILFFNLRWLHAIDPKWANATLLPVLESHSSDDRDAAWSGFLWGAQVPSPALYRLLKSSLIDLAVQPQSFRRAYTEALAGILLAGWGSIEEESGKRFISNEEMKSVLLRADDDFRSRVLWQLERWSSREHGTAEEKWSNTIVEFLGEVWPRQISARSSNISARLIELAFSEEGRFSDIADVILPLLTKIERDQVMLPNLRRSKDNIVDRDPERVLALLDAILPELAASWPYGIDAHLHRIPKAAPSLNADSRLIDLRRRWDAR